LRNRVAGVRILVAMATRAWIPPSTAPRRPEPPRRRAWGVLVAFVLLVLIGAFVAAAALWSGVTLTADPVALATVQTQPFAGTIDKAVAFGPDGRAIPLSVQGGTLTPLAPVAAGEQITVQVTVRRPGWLAWALGATRTEQLTIDAPAAHVLSRWLSVPSGSPVRVQFDQAVSAVAYGSPGHLERQTLAGPERSLTLLSQATSGVVQVAAAVRSWERLSAPVTIHWFPPAPAAAAAVATIRPAPGTQLAPGQAIRMTLSRPVSDVFGPGTPTLEPSSAQGRWSEPDPHTLVFTPTGLGVPLFTGLQLVLPHAISLVDATGVGSPTTDLSWTTPSATTLRLQQLLAQLGYLPLDWRPSGAPVARTAAAEVAAAVDPPQGSFTWRYANTPSLLEQQWSSGRANLITKGAVMMFEHEHGLAIDGIAGPMVWHALLADVLAGRRHTAPYSYVFVRQKQPELLTLWSAGHVVLTSPGNTGIASRPTQAGTFTVFEHIPVGTMTGTNPDGSHYHDPGIRFISYFNGGDAIHEFPRASYGTPQSLGCVELPLADAARVYPYTPIGTLVTIEHS
jgi:peptidoglycan hydrolase-like protein with peptidoglycan-binding domain